MKLTFSPHNEQEQKTCKGIAKEKTIFKKETLMKETCLANRFWNDLRVVKISCLFWNDLRVVKISCLFMYRQCILNVRIKASFQTRITILFFYTNISNC